MPYQPYQPNWTGQYMAAMQQPMQYQQPAQYQQQPQQPTQFQQPMAQVAQQMSGVMKVDGPDEAMSTASPEEREKMMREMRTMLGM